MGGVPWLAEEQGRIQPWRGAHGPVLPFVRYAANPLAKMKHPSLLNKKEKGKKHQNRHLFGFHFLFLLFAFSCLFYFF
jgi:hypothetical protein